VNPPLSELQPSSPLIKLLGLDDKVTQTWGKVSPALRLYNPPLPSMSCRALIQRKKEGGEGSVKGRVPLAAGDLFTFLAPWPSLA
jgi:hypothetical protein